MVKGQMVRHWSPGLAGVALYGILPGLERLLPALLRPQVDRQVIQPPRHRRRNSYANLAPFHILMPVAKETLGCFSPLSLQFIKNLGKIIIETSGDKRSRSTCSKWSLLPIREEICHNFSMIRNLKRGVMLLGKHQNSMGAQRTLKLS